MSGLQREHDTEEAIRRLEYQRRDAILAHDLAALDRLLAPELVTVTANGTIATKADELAVNARGTRTVLSWEFLDLDVRVYGDAAISTIHASFTDVLGGHERTERQRITHVWVQAHERWQLVSRHATRSEEG